MKKYSLATTVIAICLIVLTFIFISTISKGTIIAAIDGLILLCCTALFAGIVITINSAAGRLRA